MMTQDILQQIQQRAIASHSDAIYITRKAELLLEWTSEPSLPPIEIMSIGKSLVALAIGSLMDQKKISNIDVPIYHFYPEWRQGDKEQVTLRMIMNHTSGLQTIPGGDEITRAPDCVQLALCAELSVIPGKKFFYNNKSVNILSGIIHQVSGLPLDEYVKKTFFDPMGIQEFGWCRDAMKNPYSTGGVQMHAKDLHKIGLLILKEGMWFDQRLLSRNWIHQMLTPSPESDNICGLLWWAYQNPTLFAGQGYLGQWLYIFPDQEIIAIRQMRKDKTPLDQVDEFKDFKDLLSHL